MAKSTKSDQVGKIKVRIIELEMEGSDESLQEGLRSLAAALNRGINPNVGAKPVRHEQIIQNANPAPSGSQQEQSDQVEDVDQEEAVAQRKPRKPAKVVPASVLQDIRFDNVVPKLVDFATGKDPTSDLSKYLVVAYWFKFYKETPDLSGNHFYTAYKLMGWKVPRDVSQPMRDLRANRDGRFSKGTETGTYTINHIGENAVDKMGVQ